MRITLLLTSLILCACHPGGQPGNTSYRFHYDDDFEDERPGRAPSHWTVPMGQQAWIVEGERKNKYLVQDSPDPGTRQAWLHLFERNPRFSGKFRVDGGESGSVMAILVRYNAEGSWIRFEYDAEAAEFKLIEQEDIGRNPRVLDRNPWTAGNRWHAFEIMADSLSIQCNIDGKLVLGSDQLKHCTFGRIGFETRNCRLALDDISYAGNQGRPNDGIVEGEIRIPLDDKILNDAGRPFWALHMGVIPQADDALLGLVGFRDHNSRDNGVPYPFGVIRSDDRGITWSGTSLGERTWLISQEGIAIRGIWPNITEVDGGHILMGYDEDTRQNTAFFSPDGGETWTKRGEINVTEALMNIYMGHPWHRFMMTMPGKLSTNSMGLYYPTTRVLWYSADQGFTWTPEYVFHKECSEGYNPRSQEHQVVELEDGRLAVYSRDDGARESKPESMTIVKRFSKDTGKSWSDYQIDNTPFVASKCAFSIKEDPYGEGTVWMFWMYNNKNDEPTLNNVPRTRLGLAVSRDHAKTWEYVMDVDDWGYPSHDTSTFDFDPDARGRDMVEQSSAFLQRDNRYANLSLWAGPDYLYLNARRRFRHGKPKFEDFCIFYTRVNKSKILTYPDFPGTRY